MIIVKCVLKNTKENKRVQIVIRETFPWNPYWGKDLCRYGRNTQIYQLQGRGTQKPHSFTETIFFYFFCENTLLIMNMTPVGKTQFDVENSVNSD